MKLVSKGGLWLRRLFLDFCNSEREAAPNERLRLRWLFFFLLPDPKTLNNFENRDEALDLGLDFEFDLGLDFDFDFLLP